MIKYPKHKEYIFSLLLVLASLLFSQSVQAVGVGVKPSKIDLNIIVGKKTEIEILVINVASQPAIYQIYPDTLKKILQLLQTNFNSTQVALR